MPEEQSTSTAKGMVEKVRPARPRIAWLIPQSEPFVLERGAYARYVSTAKGQERRWRLFSTFPYLIRLPEPSASFPGVGIRKD